MSIASALLFRFNVYTVGTLSLQVDCSKPKLYLFNRDRVTYAKASNSSVRGQRHRCLPDDNEQSNRIYIGVLAIIVELILITKGKPIDLINKYESLI